MNEYMEGIYKLSYIKRYSNVPRLHEESVAEHGFFVAAIVMKLKEEYTFDLGVALQIAVSHDMPESELNDIPWTIKDKYPKIKEAFAECEKDVLNNMPQSVGLGVMLFESQRTIEAQIVKLADAMQVLQYAQVELKLGNSGHFNEVAYNAKMRIENIEQEIYHAKK